MWVQSAAAGSGQSQRVQTGRAHWEQLCREGLEGFSGWKPTWASNACVCGPESNCILGCIRRGNASRLREVILSFCSIILRPNLKYCIMSGGPQHKRDRDTLKQAQSRPWRTSASWRTSPMKQDDRKGIVHFGEDKALEKPYSSLPVPKGVL